MRVLSVIFESIAGFLLFMVCVLAFIKEPESGKAGFKMGILIGFAVAAGVSLALGLALSRFRLWMRDFGVVLFSVSAVMIFIAIMAVCMFMSDEFRAAMAVQRSPADLDKVVAVYSDYVTGVGMTAALAVLGSVFLWASRERTVLSE